MKNTHKRILIIVLLLVVMSTVPFLVPTGSETILDFKHSGTELLVNPSLSNNASGWETGSWRSLSQTPHPSDWRFEDGKVSVFMGGNDTSFYVSEIVQKVNVPVSNSVYLFTWRGSVDDVKLLAAGVLGVGVNLWFDVIEDGVVKEELELLVFFYQQGFYSIPVGSFKDYGYRGTNWFENIVDSPSRDEDSWRFFYFHPVQLAFGESVEVTFSLNRCLDVVRGNGYADSGFRLKSVHSVMELFNAEGRFSTETLSLIMA